MLAISLENVLSAALPKSCRCRLFSSVFETKTRSYRRHSRHPDTTDITPVRVRNADTYPRNTRYERDQEMNTFRKDYWKEVQEYGDVMEEPNAKMFTKTIDSYMEETVKNRMRVKSRTMFRKHFKDLEPKEMSLLTWAEVENIRYLSTSDPENWTPEAISQAYPISPKGVEKLLKSAMSLRRLKDVKSYDERIAQRIRNIKAGIIPMTEELEARMKIRDAIPLKVGDLGMTAGDMVELGLCKVPKTLGEFAKLVAPPQDKVDSSKKENEQVVKYIKDGEYYKPSELALYPDLKSEMSQEELRKIIPVNKLMTFRQFETKMQRNDTKSLSADMKYMLNLKAQSNHKAKASDILSKNEIELPDDSKISFPSKIRRYKSPEETGTVDVTVEGNEGYIYQPDTGYEKPFEQATPKVRERISIPDELRKSGATYKVGDCYYDEDGEFLYRVP
ncbi:Neugrin [Orchesella cincta]|uniref:Neugrin n=1 Tax=Orchesella cincta TaxID=48709 RepID=A0A1D2N9N1_ORCCI|nr:Neugrin [Orchesella cincta]